MKAKLRVLAATICAVMFLSLMPALPAAAITSGSWEYEIENGKATVLYYDGTATSVTVPSTLGGYSVAKIGEYAFSGNQSLVTVTIPNSVTTIAYGAFEDCGSLKTANLGTGIKTIETIAFRECTALTSANLPAGLQEIEDEAFMNTALASVTIPKNLTTIEGNPFAGCLKLKSFTVSGGNFQVKSNALYSADGTKIIAYPAGLTSTSYSIPSGTTTVGSGAFSGAENLTKITFPSSVKVIESFAFASCTSLADITLPSGLTKLGNYAFTYCYSMTSLSIPAATTNVGCGVAATSGIKSFTVASGNTAYSASNGILYNKAGTKLVSYPAGKGTTSFTAADKVTSTEEYAFADCHYLKTVSLPGLVTMGESTFSGCEALTTFTFPSGLKVISEGAFEFCTSLKSVTFPSQITTIGGWAYYGCESLTSVTIPATVKLIGEDVFGNCPSSLTIRCASNSAAHNYAKAEGISFYLTDVTKPTITTQPQSQTSAPGKTVTFKIIASGTGLSYQWQYRTASSNTWKDWSGKTSSSVSVTASTANNGCQYRCVVNNSGGSATSSAATLTVVEVPTITAQPQSQTTASGTTVTFKVTATGNGLSYQWQYKTASSSTWKDWSGKTSSSVAVTASSANNGCQYRCVVKNSEGGSVASSAAKLTVTAAGSPVITTQPQSKTVATGSGVTFTVAASGAGLSYQWQYKTVSSSTWKDWSEKTSSSVSVTASSANNGCQYRCIVKNSNGSATSSSAKLTVMDKPTISTHPQNQTVASGKTATFKVVATGTGLSYQWQYKTASSSTWKDWSGKTTASVTVTASSSNNGCQYRCVVKNAVGTVTSSAAKLTVS